MTDDGSIFSPLLPLLVIITAQGMRHFGPSILPRSARSTAVFSTRTRRRIRIRRFMHFSIIISVAGFPAATITAIKTFAYRSAALSPRIDRSRPPNTAAGDLLLDAEQSPRPTHD
jgi:hypothetical protein